MRTETRPVALPIAAAALSFVAALLLTLPAAAQAPVGPRFELTPFAGYRLDGEVESEYDFFDPDLQVDESAVYGVTADFALNPNMQIELLASRQDSELSVGDELFGQPATVLADITLTTVHVGFLYQWLPGQANPFVVVSGGLTEIDPDDPAFDSDTRLSASIGGGVKLRFTPNLGLRLEARVFVTDVDTSFGEGELRDRRFDDDDDVLVQPEGSVGLILAF